jgi:tricorn protease-like protein
LVEWPSNGTITLTTKPSSGVGGYMYFLNTKTESFKKILGGITNLTTLTSSDLSKVLYSSGASLYVYDISEDESTSIPINTLSEKCVWSEIGSSVVYCGMPKDLPQNLPESWYQGLTTLSDSIWKIDMETGQTDLLIEPEEEFGVSVDMTELILNKEDSYLMFVNKKDSTLWVLELKEESL